MNTDYNIENLDIVIYGGGNIGTQFACKLASLGYGVTVFTRNADKFSNTLQIIDEHDRITEGRIKKATDNIAEALSRDTIKEKVTDKDDSLRKNLIKKRMIIVTHPAFRLAAVGAQILPYVDSDTTIMVLPGTGGAEFAFADCIRKGATLAGLQRVPSVARIEEVGKRVRCEGIRNELHVAAIPHSRTHEIANFMSEVWGIPCHVLPNYLSVTLTPSNPILHTTRLRTLFADYEPGKVYDRNPLFYGEWSDESSKLLIQADEELQQMCRMMEQSGVGDIDLSNVRSLKLHYESDTVEAMTAKLRNIESLHNLKSPMKEVEGGFIPDFESRYFRADFPYGLAIIESIAEVLGFKAPAIEETMNWYRTVTGDEKRFDIRNCGLHTVEDIYKYYHGK